MESAFLIALGLVAILVMQYVRGARYTGFQVVLGVVAGFALVFAFVLLIEILGAAVGEMGALWLVLIAVGAVAVVAGSIVAFRAARRPRSEEPMRSPFHLG